MVSILATIRSSRHSLLTFALVSATEASQFRFEDSRVWNWSASWDNTVPVAPDVYATQILEIRRRFSYELLLAKCSAPDQLLV